MRWVLLSIVMLLAACPQGSADLAGVNDPNLPDESGAVPQCFDDTDCELASKTCCQCPTFALPASDPKLGACNDVSCPPMNGTCSRVRAACDMGACVVACEAVPVTMTCADGFALDAAGCLIDACATPRTDCTTDTDCVRTRADCCGCTRGGSDTAVPRGQLASHDQMLGCTGGELCPDVNACDAGETPQCAQGSCKLIAGGLPADACGRPDLPACPQGTTCTVNASDPANLHGVGVCR